MKNIFLIRVDASEKIGLGHMMRSIALGQILQDQGCEVHFATSSQTKEIETLVAENFFIHPLAIDFQEKCDAMAVSEIAKTINADWIVIDGVQFSGGYEAILKKSIFDKKILRIVDQPSEQHSADVLLCQNFGAETMEFKVKPHTKKLLGLEYLLLRRDFKDAAKKLRVESHSVAKKRIMVSMGGSEIASIASEKLAAIVASIDDFDYEVVIFDRKPSAYDVNSFSYLQRRIFNKGFSQNMAKEMCEVDFAIVAGGSVMWELMYMRVPFMAVALSEAQESYIRLLGNEGLCINLGHYLNITPKLIENAIGDMISQPGVLDEFKRRYSALLERNNLESNLVKILLH